MCKLSRKKAYVIVGYNPKNGEVAGYHEHFNQLATLNYITYIIPDMGCGFGSLCRTAYSNSKNQTEWFELRVKLEWVKAKWPNFKWRIYRAHSKYCPIEIDMSEIYKIERAGLKKNIKKIYTLPFKVKNNWNWGKDV